MTGRRALLVILAVLVAGGRPSHGAFNEIIAGARPQGMGAAFVAIADDANALVWNPAGLTQIPSAEATFMHAKEFNLTVGPSLDLDFFGFVNWPMNVGTFGLAAYRQGNSAILTENVVSLSFARDVSKISSFGFNTKVLNMNPAGAQVSANDPALRDQTTVSFDVGFLHSMTPFWKLGLAVRNIGGEIGTVTRDELETTYRFGSAYRFEDIIFLADSVTWAVDVFTKEDIEDRAGVKIRAATGLEYSVDERVTFRAGVDRGKLTLGIGFGHPESGIFIDYGWEDDTIGKTQRLAATYRFGAPPGEVHVVHHVPRPRPSKARPRDEEEKQPEPPPPPRREPSIRRPTRSPLGRAPLPREGEYLARRKGPSEFERELREFMRK